MRTRVPFVHFFDGFRTSHELNTIELLSDDDLRALVPHELVEAHRGRSLSPERPFIRGTAQNPDVYFQARETVNPFYARMPESLRILMAQLGERTGRKLKIVDYTGHPQAERVLVAMGSGAETVAETVDALVQRGERVGLVTVRLYRPFPSRALLDALPRVGAQHRRARPDQGAGLDRRAALPRRRRRAHRSRGRRRAAHAPRLRRPIRPVVQGVHAAMVAGVFAELANDKPRRRFTIGIDDDVSGSSLSYDPAFDIEAPDTVRAVFYGLGSDGTVGANKNTIKILGSEPELHAQGYFVYDSKKSGSQTVSHLRFGPRPIRAAVPGVQRRASSAATSSACSIRSTCSAGPRRGATLLLNCRYSPDVVWDALSRPVQEQILAKDIEVYTIDAGRLAREAGLAGRTNIILQTCFFAISGVLPAEQAIAADQGIHRQDLRQARSRRRRPQPGGRRPHARGPAPGQGAGSGDGRPAGCR